MSWVDWLVSPDGHAFAIAAVALLQAITVAITVHNGRQLNGHIKRHHDDEP
jgi:hypothetical protein